MYCVSTKTVKEFEYTDELMMKLHEDEMINDGWNVTDTIRWGFSGGKSVADTLYREYTFHHLDGVFL